MVYKRKPYEKTIYFKYWIVYIVVTRKICEINLRVSFVLWSNVIGKAVDSLRYSPDLSLPHFSCIKYLYLLWFQNLSKFLFCRNSISIEESCNRIFLSQVFSIEVNSCDTISYISWVELQVLWCFFWMFRSISSLFYMNGHCHMCLSPCDLMPWCFPSTCFTEFALFFIYFGHTFVHSN